MKPANRILDIRNSFLIMISQYTFCILFSDTTKSFSDTKNSISCFHKILIHFYIRKLLKLYINNFLYIQNLTGMLHHKSRSACAEIIHVRKFLAELWSLTLRIFTLLACLLNSSYKSRSACGEIINIRQILAEFWSLALRIFTHFGLSSQLLSHLNMDLNETWQGCCNTSLEVHVVDNSCSTNFGRVMVLDT